MAKPNSARRKGDGEFVEVKRSSGVRTSRKVGGKSHTDVAKSKSLIFQPRPDWYAADLPPIDPPKASNTPSTEVLEQVYNYAVELLHEENSKYSGTHLTKSSSHKFMSTIMASGTWEDKVSALTLVIQESPLHTMKPFENLLGMARKRSRNQALMALGALKDLLGQGLVLPSDRKLKSFTKQPGLLGAFQGTKRWDPENGLPQRLEKVHLIYWAFEDWLKKQYFELLKVLEQWCIDEIEFARLRALTFVWELLKDKPEQEENLLRLLVNKLGDKEKKVASRTSYLLLQLQTTHPLMKTTIINSIESDLLFRPGQSSHAKYYAVITMNQTILSLKEEDVANKLLEIYFNLFLAILKQKDWSKPVDGPAKNSQGQVQGGGGKPGKKAAAKAKMQEQAGKSDDEMYEKMISQILAGVNRAFPYARANDATFEGLIDTVFRVTHSSNFNTSIQALMLVQQISSSKHYSADRFYRVLYESLLDPRLLNSSKQTMYLNLLYKALKNDLSIKRVKAFIKRILQILTLHEAPFICGALYLISQLELAFPGIKTMLNESEAADEDGEEHFFDVPEGSYLSNGSAPDSQTPKPAEDIKPRYDPRKRDPEHANADRTCLWELTLLIDHFHPSVSLFASRLLHLPRTTMPPAPDISTHTLIHFLDRFAYRNARQASSDKTRGTSIMQPLAGSNAADRLLITAGKGAATIQAPPVNSVAFWQKRAEDVGEDEAFFHQYFQKNGKRKRIEEQEKKKKVAEKGDGDSEDEKEEDKIWKALVKSRPEIEGEESDLDEGFSDEEDLEDLDEDEKDGGIGIENLDGILNDDDDDDDDGPDEKVNHVRVQQPGRLQSVREDDDDDDDDDDNIPDLGENEDDDAFYNSDDGAPSDLDELFRKEEFAMSEGPPAFPSRNVAAVANANVDNATGQSGASGKRKKRKLKHLPTFASADDYAKLLAGDDDGGEEGT